VEEARLPGRGRLRAERHARRRVVPRLCRRAAAVARTLGGTQAHRHAERAEKIGERRILGARDVAREEVGEIAAGDLDLFPFDGEKIDLEPLFREQFVLAIPYAPLCREDCKGLCPQCGIDRNTGTCSCEKPIDPRLAALKGLKLPS